MTAPPPPEHLSEASQALWGAITGAYALEPQHLELAASIRAGHFAG